MNVSTALVWRIVYALQSGGENGRAVDGYGTTLLSLLKNSSSTPAGKPLIVTDLVESLCVSTLQCVAKGSRSSSGTKAAATITLTPHPCPSTPQPLNPLTLTLNPHPNAKEGGGGGVAKGTTTAGVKDG
jgi:hypothetical protein